VLAFVLVLALGAADPGLPYAPLPSRAELGGLTDRLAHDLRGTGVRVVRAAQSCDDNACALRLARERGARAVVFGATLRAMAMIWSTQATVVDVASGRSTTFDAGYKGDYLTMCVGIDELAGAVTRALPASEHAPQT
jgi:hypothetical protein